MANEPSFSFDKTLGGLNWGFCKKTQGNDNKYIAVVTTSQKENSETTYSYLLNLVRML